jgi:anaerobic selenocysteine-containing dehydrogenase
VVLNEIAKDPARSMIVIDPVVTDTAKMADFHLRVRPGTDAWCLAALAAVLVQENLCDEAFLAAHVRGADAVRQALRDVAVCAYAAHCSGVLPVGTGVRGVCERSDEGRRGAWWLVR